MMTEGAETRRVSKRIHQNPLDESDDSRPLIEEKNGEQDQEDDSSDDEKNTIKIHPITPASSQGKRKKSSFIDAQSSPSTRRNNLINNLWPPLLSRQGSSDSQDNFFDERNVVLVDLQRKKVMTYAENIKLENEVEQLRAQLLLLENLEKKSTSDPNINKINNNDDNNSNNNTARSSGSVSNKFHQGRLSRQNLQQHTKEGSDEETDNNSVYSINKKESGNGSGNNSIRHSGRRNRLLKENSQSNNNLDSSSINKTNNGSTKQSPSSNVPLATDLATSYHIDEKRSKRRQSASYVQDPSPLINTSSSSTKNSNSTTANLSTAVPMATSGGTNSLRPRRRVASGGIANDTPSTAGDLDSSHTNTNTNIGNGSSTKQHQSPDHINTIDTQLSTATAGPSTPNNNSITANHLKRPHFHRIVNTSSSASTTNNNNNNNNASNSSLQLTPRSVLSSSHTTNSSSNNHLNNEGSSRLSLLPKPASTTNTTNTNATNNTASHSAVTSEYIPSTSASVSQKNSLRIRETHPILTGSRLDLLKSNTTAQPSPRLQPYQQSSPRLQSSTTGIMNSARQRTKLNLGLNINSNTL